MTKRRAQKLELQTMIAFRFIRDFGSLSTLVLVLTLFSVVTNSVYSAPPKSYQSGKAVAAQLWQDIGPYSFYCKCSYRHATPEEKSRSGGNLWVIRSPCGYMPRNPIRENGKINGRALRIEFEHVVPANMLKTGFGCANRTACRKNPGFRLAEGDLHNLVPVIGELNEDRSNKEYGHIPSEERAYGQCDFEVTGSHAEPEESIRGDLARVSLYMVNKYGLKLPKPYIQLLNDWHLNDPVDSVEKARHSVIAEEMESANPYLVE